MATVYYEDYIEDSSDKYDESQDDDFNPADAPPDDEPSSSDDSDHAPAKPAPRSGKRKAPGDEELDSGDEATIQAARKRKSKKQKRGKEAGDAGDAMLSDGDGGLIKTRAQRRVGQVETRPPARTEGATVDVDALWAQMTAAPLKSAPPVEPRQPDPSLDPAPTATSTKPPPATVEEEEHVSITKTYTFAGQDTTEEKSVPRSHLDKYISDGWKAVDAAERPAAPSAKPQPNTSKIRRPLRRPSRFDPNPTGYVRTLAPEHQLTYPRAPTANTASGSALMPPPELPAKGKDKTQKLNVVDKSRMDWTGFVDKEGIAEELDTHGKTKEAYLGRMEFLAGVEARREEERKRVKVAAAPT
ncbi:bucentaur or craniofacial development-domain-containing protein [Ampelomyces quisqualis]|uniref:SWR1-complex protein 5 n=1 Tax=Ampelomyces quisqualis TaxID=50730 RepID=A0A6A5QIK2_AMPQU|nr:bucentaur or craniofacial development-domain-containing protein [Ampelomyces quisqualis]